MPCLTCKHSRSVALSGLCQEPGYKKANSQDSRQCRSSRAPEVTGSRVGTVGLVEDEIMNFMRQNSVETPTLTSFTTFSFVSA